MASFENLHFEKNHTKTAAFGIYGEGIYRMDPIISASEFEFYFKGKLSCVSTCLVNFGVMKEDHQTKNGYIGYTHGIGWSFWLKWGRADNPLNVPHRRVTSFKNYSNGDTFGFRVSKSKKTIEFLLNGKSEGVTHSSCDFPDELYIAVSFNCGGAKLGDFVELVDFKDLSRSPKNDVDMVLANKESQDRLDFILEKCCDFQIPLLNKTLDLCKPFLINSNIQDLPSISEFRGLLDISLDVEENIILQIILGLQTQTSIKTDCLFDYFRFFKRLGLKREMFEILEKLQSSPQLNSFKPCFELFVECAKIDENEEIKTWFTNSPKMLEDVNFHNSFSLCLFNKMKSFESELTFSSPLMLLPSFGVVTFHVKSAKFEDLKTHHDFSLVSLHTLTAQKMFSKLYQDEKMLNLKLLSCDEPPSELFTHREVLILKSNFFHNMFNFGGRETEELNSTSSVQLEDLGVKEMEALVRYYYLGEVVCTSLETFIMCSIHCHKYFELGLLSKLMDGFLALAKKSSDSELIDFIKGTFYKVESKKLRERIISNSGGKFDEGKIKEILKESEKNSILSSVLEENRLLKERVEILEEKQEEMNVTLKRVLDRLERLDKQ